MDDDGVEILDEGAALGRAVVVVEVLDGEGYGRVNENLELHRAFRTLLDVTMRLGVLEVRDELGTRGVRKPLVALVVDEVRREGVAAGRRDDVEQRTTERMGSSQGLLAALGRGRGGARTSSSSSLPGRFDMVTDERA
jgi:hypothetical protein